jgi:hypothetical protein
MISAIHPLPVYVVVGYVGTLPLPAQKTMNTGRHLDYVRNPCWRALLPD